MNPFHHGIALALLFTAAALAQGEAKEEVKQDPALPGKLEELKKMARDPRMTQDAAAAAQVEALAASWSKLNSKDQDKVSAAIGGLFADGKLRPPGSDVLYHAAAKALGGMKEDGAKQLRKAIEGERFHDPEYVPMRVKLIEAVGDTADVHQVEFLLELARRAPQDEIMAAAGGALGSMTSMDLQKRRTVVKDLIRRWGELEQKGSQLDPVPTQGGAVDFSGENARKTLLAIRPKWKGTLVALTGEAHGNHPEWQRWLNKNPDWTPPGGGVK